LQLVTNGVDARQQQRLIGAALLLLGRGLRLLSQPLPLFLCVSTPPRNEPSQTKMAVITNHKTLQKNSMSIRQANGKF
jgi:hypothetical protein